MRATYDVDDGQALIHVRGLSSLSARHQGRPASIHPLPLSAPWQHRRRDLHHVRCPLKVSCMRTSVLPSFYALFNCFHVGIAMILQPCCWLSDSPHAWPNPIPMGGAPQPQRGRMPPRPFQGPQTCPQPRRESRQRLQSLLSSSLPPPLSSSSSSTGLSP
jgi:hypothetical protein